MPRQKRTGWWAVEVWPEDEPEKGGVWVEGPLNRAGFWWVAVLFVRHRDQFVIAELRLFPASGLQKVTHYKDGTVKDREPRIGEWSGDLGTLAAMPAGGITKRLLGSVSFQKLLKEAQQQLSTALADDPPLRNVADLSGMRDAAMRPGRPRRPDADYLVWAERYERAIADGSNAPIRDLAKRYRRRAEDVRDLIHEARVRGLLTPGHQGTAGGQLTPKAHELRRDTDNQKRRKR